MAASAFDTNTNTALDALAAAATAADAETNAAVLMQRLSQIRQRTDNLIARVSRILSGGTGGADAAGGSGQPI